MTFRKNTTIMAMALLAGMLTLIPISASADIDDNLVSHFAFDGNTIDSSENSNDGTVTGTEQYVYGEIREAIYLDDTSYVTLSNESNFDFERTDPSTFAFWYKITTPIVGNGWALSKAISFGAGVWGAFDSTGDFNFALTNTDPTNRLYESLRPTITNSGIADLDDGTWNHLAITYDGSSTPGGLNWYLNGKNVNADVILVSNTLSASILNNETFKIGKHGGSHCPNCIFDDYRIYDVELTSAQVQEIYQQSPVVHAALAEATLADLQSQITSLQSQVTSVNATVQHNVTEIDDLYDFWDDLKDSIITWLAARP